MSRPLVALAHRRRSEQAAAILACWEAGEAVLPLDPRAPDAVRERLVARGRPTHMADGAERWRLDGGLPVDDAVALVAATSGTTGEPELAELDGRALDWSAAASLRRTGVPPGRGWACPLPTHHVAGAMALRRSLLAGADPVVLDRADADALAASGAAGVSLVPAQLADLVAAADDLSGLPTVLVGGGPTGAGLVARARTAGLRVAVGYGATETCGSCVLDGWPLDGVEVAEGCDGRLRVRGPVVLRGRRGGRPVERDALGRVVLDDVGEVDRAGTVTVRGRADAAIATGGETLHPEQVEPLLASARGVAEAAVAGRPHPRLGHEAVAVVVPADPGEPPSLEALQRAVRAGAPPWAAPRDVVVAERLPRLADGRLHRAGLARLVAGGGDVAGS